MPNYRYLSCFFLAKLCRFKYSMYALTIDIKPILQCEYEETLDGEFYSSQVVEFTRNPFDFLH